MYNTKVTVNCKQNKKTLYKNFTIRQMSNQNGYRMHFMKTTMMQGRQQELLTSTKQIRELASQLRAKTIKVLLKKLIRKKLGLFLMLKEQKVKF